MASSLDLSGVNTNLILSLRALLRERNVTLAARKVGLSQSSMSHALARLRGQLNDPLLVAVGRKMVLTERAQRLIEPVEQAVAQLERVFLKSEPFDPATSQRVFRLMATDNLELYVLPKLLGILSEEAPGISLRVQHLSSDWSERLLKGDIDLKLGRRYPVAEGLLSDDLVEERFTCIVRERHPFRGQSLNRAQYAGLRHLVVVPTPGDLDWGSRVVDPRLAEAGLQRQVALTVSHFVVAPVIVAGSDLALTASERLVEPFLRRFHLRKLRLPFATRPYRLSQVWASRSDAHDGHRWLREALARAVR